MKKIGKKERVENILEKETRHTVRSFCELEKSGNAIVAYDDTFRIVIVYLYCSFDEFLDVRGKLLETPPDLGECTGYTCYGTNKTLRTGVVIVWINNLVERSGCAPVLAHELSHLADFIALHCNTKDSNGEERAYIIEREMNRVSGMFGIGTPREFCAKAMEKAVKEYLEK